MPVEVSPGPAESRIPVARPARARPRVVDGPDDPSRGPEAVLLTPASAQGLGLVGSPCTRSLLLILGALVSSPPAGPPRDAFDTRLVGLGDRRRRGPRPHGGPEHPAGHARGARRGPRADADAAIDLTPLESRRPRSSRGAEPPSGGGRDANRQPRGGGGRRLRAGPVRRGGRDASGASRSRSATPSSP